MGSSSSKAAHRLDKALGTSMPDDAHFFGLENFGNTCYCNSVLQALYYCLPFRDACLAYAQANESRGPDDLLHCLCDLFRNIHQQKKRCGVIGPRKFVLKLREENELFSTNMHQDAHEFLNYVLNEATEILDGTKARAAEQRGGQRGGSAVAAAADGPPLEEGDAVSGSGASKSPGGVRRPAPKTWVHDIFEGTLTNETKCLTCETVTTRDEHFLDLSLDIEQNSSVSNCLRSFSTVESLRDGDKYYCDTCCSLQEGQKRLRIKRLPPVLALHLKRFKYIEQLGRYKKLAYRVVFPHELRVRGTLAKSAPPAMGEGAAAHGPSTPRGGRQPFSAEESEGEGEDDVIYDLFSVVIHVGQGPNHGHYVSIVKSHNRWLLFDDETVELIDEQSIAACYGSTQEGANNTDVGYLLFYQARDAPLSPLAQVPPPDMHVPQPSPA
ncbi:putative ubiquitin carboxyl-terminal hydrolase [Pavlovales sp. CCMP2436]|nr:putative ubiquitin carboxyl-terminal hydrolase [Pavlovales sp. CCMP2436]